MKLRTLSFTLHDEMAKILTIGSVTRDIFLPTGEGVLIETPEDLLSQKKIAFELGAKYHITERSETLGGCPINVAAGLAKMGEQVQCYAPVGNDETGNWIREKLLEQGIDAEHLVVVDGKSSDASSIIIDKSSGERVIFSGHSASEVFDVEAAHIEDQDWIFVGDLSGDWKRNIDVIISVAKERRINIAFNPREKAIQQDAKKIVETISLCDLIFVNKDEALEILSSIGDLKSDDETYLVKELKRAGVGIVALTDGKRGAWVFDGETILQAGALLHADTVDTTGAGDAFASGFFAALLKGKDLADALKWGIANSSSSIRQYGGQKGLLSEKEIEQVAYGVEVRSLD